MSAPTKQEIEDIRNAPKAEKAYNAAEKSTPPNPKPAASAPVKKMASGGYVRAADGIAKKGKTKGRIC